MSAWRRDTSELLHEDSSQLPVTLLESVRYLPHVFGVAKGLLYSANAGLFAALHDKICTWLRFDVN